MPNQHGHRPMEKRMATDQEGVGALVRISRNEAGKWEVLDGIDPPASFESRDEACEYANRLVAGRSGPSAVVLQEGTQN